MLTEEQIQFLNRVCPDRWTEKNGIIDVNGDVNISHMNLTQIPIQFGKITGNFYCRNNKLTTLKGCPYVINKSFDCDSNNLSTLQSAIIKIGGYYSCQQNQLTNLIGAPKICNGSFDCRSNKLTSLEGCPLLIKEYFMCKYNSNLEFLFFINKIKGNIYYDNHNDINLWIINLSRKNFIFLYNTLEENIQWIKDTHQYSVLLNAPREITQYFSPYIINSIKTKLC